MEIVYAKQPFPNTVTKSIFLAGPTPRSSNVVGWRQQALEALSVLGYDGHVFVPEPEDQKWGGDYTDQVEWEDEGLNRADCIVFWIPRKMTDMPALTTNDEWGVWKDSGKVVIGAPTDAQHVRYQGYYADKLKIPTADTLVRTLMNAIDMIGAGARREGGECHVPILIWKLGQFQQWYSALKKAGNRLDSAKVHYTFRVGKRREVIFMAIIHANVHITAEGRNKTNEIVIMRPDVSSVVLWHPGHPLMETPVAIVGEFRTPVRNPVGIVYELPGGSSKHTLAEMAAVAAEEVEEEAGLKINPDALVFSGNRQLAATTLSHHAWLFSYKLSDAELATLRSNQGKTFGVEADTERTHVVVKTIGEIMNESLVDWTTLGQIFQVIH